METLLIGNVAYWSDKTLKMAFGDNHIVVVGKDSLYNAKGRRITGFPILATDEEFEAIFSNYMFERVIYIPEYLTFHGGVNAELENLRCVLQKCHSMQTKQIVYLSPIDVCADIKSSQKILLQSLEDMCHYYMEENWLPIKIIRTPYLCSGMNPKDYFFGLFEQMDTGGKIMIKENQHQTTCFIDMEDLARFLFRLFDNWIDGSETLTLFGSMDSTFDTLGKKLQQLKPEIEVNYTNQKMVYQLELGENHIRSQYGWFAEHDVIEEMDHLYQSYHSIDKKKQLPIAKWMEKVIYLKSIFIMMELILGSFMVEGLNILLETTVQFQLIDVRLLFVVLMSNIYGMNVGLGAAFLEVISICYSYYKVGMNWQTIFYEPSNWVPFILYFTAAAILGYLKEKNEDSISFAQKESQLIEEKYLFMNTLYQGALENKSEYRKQIIGSRDSFGKIFEIVKQLDTSIPQKIFAETIPVLEEVLENHSIAIYSLCDKNAVFGRLEVSSHAINNQLPKSIRLEEFGLSMDTLNRGEVWFNQEFVENYPMYIAGVKQESDLLLLIMVYHVDYSQMSIYYSNLFRIICGLIENAFLKAWQYQEVIYHQRHVGNTMIIREKDFLEQLSLKHDMLENKIAQYVLLQIQTGGRTYEQMDALLRLKIRDNDILGECRDGNLYLLLSQADELSVQRVLKRLNELGLTCVVVNHIG
ncbi:MAG: hypothetical protein RR768_07235 [Clostridium sp.]